MTVGHIMEDKLRRVCKDPAWPFKILQQNLSGEAERNHDRTVRIVGLQNKIGSLSMMVSLNTEGFIL
jgi:hypothetical protein